MTTTAKILLEQRAALVADARKIYETAEAESRTLNAEERVKWDKMHADADALKTRADDFHKLETADDVADDELRYQEPGVAPGNKKRADEDPNKLTRDDALRAFMLGPYADMDLADRCRRSRVNHLSPSAVLRYERPGKYLDPARNSYEAEQRYNYAREQRHEQRAPQHVTDMDTFTPPAGTDGPTGGFLVANEMMAGIEKAEFAYGGMKEASTTRETATGAPWPVPTMDDTDNEGEIVGAGQEVGDGQVAFGQIVLGAHMYNSKMIKVSLQALQDPSTPMVDIISEVAGQRIGKIKNRHHTLGDGDNKPRGIVTDAVDSGITNAVVGELDWRQLVQHKHSLTQPYRKGPGVGWMVSSKMHEMMKTMSDANNRPLWLPSIVPGEPDLFDGDPLVENYHLPSTGTGFAALFGMLSKYWIRQVRQYELMRADERFIEFGQVAFLLWQRSDGRLIDAGQNPVKKMSVQMTA